MRPALALPARAVVYMCVSAAAFAVMYVLAKRLEGYGGFALVFFRGLGTFLLALAYLLARGVRVRGNRPALLFARGATGAASLTLFFFAIAYVPIAAAVAVRYLAPLFAIVFALAFLGERVRPAQWVYFAVAFAGVALLQGVDARFTSVGLALVLGSAVLGGATFAIIRALGPGEHPLVIVAYFTGSATLVGALGLVGGPDAWVRPSPTDWWLLGSLGVVGFVGQVFMTIAMQTADASHVMPLKYMEAVFLLGLSGSFLGETYGAWALVGMGLIVAGNLANVFGRKPEAEG